LFADACDWLIEFCCCCDW